MIKFRSSIKWIYFVSRRFSRVDSKGHAGITSSLASLGIALGVMALIAIMSVMNGFQMEFIDAIMEISSFHVQTRNVENESDFLQFCTGHDGQKFIKTVTPFYEAKGLLVETVRGKESASLIRALPSDIMDYDFGFKKEVELVEGEFDISDDNSIVLGYNLAVKLGAFVGDNVNIMAVSGSADVPLFSNDRNFVVKGIFYSNYQDINSSYSFVNRSAAEKYFGLDSSQLIYGLKVQNSGKDFFAISRIQREFPDAVCQSWREYNRTFFGALKIEKNVLTLLVVLIFIVVAVNIYNAMRRMIYERRQDIAVLVAFGGTVKDLESVFAVKGFITGIKGAVPGLILGILTSVNMDKIFVALAKLQYFAQYISTMIFLPEDLQFVQENSMFLVFASVPARMKAVEIMMIFLFGIFSSLFSSVLAGRRIAKLNVSEVLHDE